MSDDSRQDGTSNPPLSYLSKSKPIMGFYMWPADQFADDQSQMNEGKDGPTWPSDGRTAKGTNWWLLEKENIWNKCPFRVRGRQKVWNKCPFTTTTTITITTTTKTTTSSSFCSSYSPFSDRRFGQSPATAVGSQNWDWPLGEQLEQPRESRANSMKSPSSNTPPPPSRSATPPPSWIWGVGGKGRIF